MNIPDLEPEEDKRLAEIIYPDREWRVNGGVVETPWYSADVFDPSFDGLLPCQKEQAMDLLLWIIDNSFLGFAVTAALKDRNINYLKRLALNLHEAQTRAIAPVWLKPQQ